MKVSLFIVVMLSIVLTGCFNSDETIYYDEKAGLYWQDNTEVATTLKPYITKKNWNAKYYSSEDVCDTAWNYCKNLKFGGFRDWTLPSVSEYKSLYENKNKLTNGVSAPFWTRNYHPRAPKIQYAYRLGDGGYPQNYKYEKAFVRCVRKD